MDWKESRKPCIHLNREIKEEEMQLPLDFGNGIEWDGAPHKVLDQVEGIVDHLDPVDKELGIDVRDPPRPHMPTLRRHGAKLPPPVPDADDDGVVVEGEEILVPDLDLKAHGDGEGDGWGGGHADAVQVEADDADVGVGRPKEEEGGDEESDGEDEGEEGGGGDEGVAAAAWAAEAEAAAGERREEDVRRGIGGVGRRLGGVGWRRREKWIRLVSRFRHG